MNAVYYQSPVGPLTLIEENGALTGVQFGRATLPAGCRVAETPLLSRARRQLWEYFEGKRTEFDLPLAPAGTPFRRAVWAAMARIPYGQTATYGQLASAVGSPRAARAVGGACHANPLAILLPCHRVVGSTGSLTGFAGGLPVKEQLLALEAAHSVP